MGAFLLGNLEAVAVLPHRGSALITVSILEVFPDQLATAVNPAFHRRPGEAQRTRDLADRVFLDGGRNGHVHVCKSIRKPLNANVQAGHFV